MCAAGSSICCPFGIQFEEMVGQLRCLVRPSDVGHVACVDRLRSESDIFRVVRTLARNSVPSAAAALMGHYTHSFIMRKLMDNKASYEGTFPGAQHLALHAA